MREPPLSQPSLRDFNRLLVKAGPAAARLENARPDPDAGRWNLRRWYRAALDNLKISKKLDELEVNLRERFPQLSWQLAPAAEFRDNLKAEIGSASEMMITRLRQLGESGEVAHAQSMLAKLARLKNNAGLPAMVLAAAGLGAWQYYSGGNSPAGNPDLSGTRSARADTEPKPVRKFGPDQAGGPTVSV